MAGDAIVLQALYGVGESVASKIHERIVDLFDIACQDDFAALADAGDDGFDSWRVRF